jgi:hypothetical protein
MLFSSRNARQTKERASWQSYEGSLEEEMKELFASLTLLKNQAAAAK